MAVPPTHDGSVGPRSPRATTFVALTVTFAVVALACVTVLGVRLVNDTDTSAGLGERVSQVFGGYQVGAAGAAEGPDGEPVPVGGDLADPGVREALIARTDEFIRVLNTYGPEDLEDGGLPGYAAAVRELITPRFQTGFDQNFTLAEQTVTERGYRRRAELYATGVESVAAGRATTLVAFAIRSSFPDPDREGERVALPPLQLRFKVDLVETDGEWYVDDFVAVTTTAEGDAGQQPGTVPQPEPSQPPNRQDGQPSQQDGQPSQQDGQPNRQDGQPSQQDGQPNQQDGPRNQQPTGSPSGGPR